MFAELLDTTESLYSTLAELSEKLHVLSASNQASVDCGYFIQAPSRGQAGIDESARVKVIAKEADAMTLYDSYSIACFREEQDPRYTDMFNGLIFADANVFLLVEIINGLKDKFRAQMSAFDDHELVTRRLREHFPRISLTMLRRHIPTILASDGIDQVRFSWRTTGVKQSRISVNEVRDLVMAKFNEGQHQEKKGSVADELFSQLDGLEANQYMVWRKPQAPRIVANFMVRINDRGALKTKHCRTPGLPIIADLSLRDTLEVSPLASLEPVSFRRRRPTTTYKHFYGNYYVASTAQNDA